MRAKTVLNRILIITAIVAAILLTILFVFRPDGIMEARGGAEAFRGLEDGEWSGAYRDMHRGGRMMGYGRGGGFFFPLFIGILIFFGISRFAFRRHHFARHWHHHHGQEESGLDALDRMFAEGTIDESEYRARRDVLRRDGPTHGQDEETEEDQR